MGHWRACILWVSSGMSQGTIYGAHPCEAEICPPSTTKTMPTNMS